MEPVPLADVKDLLTQEAARRPLPREAQLALQHAESTLKLEPEQSRALLQELRALGFLEVPLAIKITDILPQWPEEVRLLVPRDRPPLDEGQVQAVLDLVAKYR
jgi:DNA-directed RNA polymerase subunit F